MDEVDAVTALKRFGLGARPGDRESIGGNPRAYVLAQLDKPDAARLDPGDLENSTEVLAAQILAQREVQLRRRAAPATSDRQPPPGPDMQTLAGEPAATPGTIRREAYQVEAAARFARALESTTPLIERLVWFWSNHFTVSGQKTQIRGIVGAFEREAIRPHVLGRFPDMLRAVVQHPAMLIYLDNHRSIGPASPVGKARSRGLNENLGREVLELHTLGVDGGYTQADVGALSRLLTGWAVGGLGGVNGTSGAFTFSSRRHEPGPVRLLGREYAVMGQARGEAALDDLARHPSTARHFASKLVRHFVADEAPPELIARAAARFRDSDGDLAAVMRVVVADDAAWRVPPRKVLPPFDYIVALSRALGLTPAPREVMRLTRLIGQPLWFASSPKGWPEEDDAWLAPSALRERLRIAQRATRELAPAVDPRRLADDLFGPGLAGPTRLAIARAETREQGLQLLAMSPEFQRR